MRHLRTALRDECGFALIAAVFLVALLTSVAVLLMSLTSQEGTTSIQAVKTNNALQAAQSGLDVYKADLGEDTGFFLDYFASGEARRTYLGTQYPTTAGANASANVAINPSWPRSAVWTYPSDITTDPGWRTLSGTSYQYLLEVFPDYSQANHVRVIAIGRPVPSAQTPAANKGNYRAVEAELSAVTISDFQMLSANDISYSSSATTTGWVYATDDDTGSPASISHSGTATANLFTEGPLSSYSGSTNLVSPARKYASDSVPSIRTVISEPITFADLRQSPQIAPIGGGEGAIQLNATASGITLPDPSVVSPSGVPNAWNLNFTSGGTVVVTFCTKNKSGSPSTYQPVEYLQPSCVTYKTYTLNQGGEDIYTAEDVIISGTVNGQVTIYTAGGGKATVGDLSNSNGDVVVSGNISYAVSGNDVLGAVATDNVIIACWETSNPLSWRAATISLNGQWISDWNLTPACGNSNRSSMTFTGSTATYNGGSMSGFTTRTYNYDSTLRYLPPPDYPQIPAAFEVLYERQIATP